MLLKAKAECTVEAPAMTVFEFLKDFSTEKKINSMISDYTISPSSSINDDYQELTMYLKMPFPLNNRDMVILFIEHTRFTYRLFQRDIMSFTSVKRKMMCL